MKVASSGSRRTMSSASRRIRAQTGSTLSSAVFACCCAIAVLSRGKKGRPFIILGGVVPNTKPQGLSVIDRADRPLAQLSGPFCQKIQPGGLKPPVADGQHVVAAGNDKGLRAGDQGGEGPRRTRHIVLLTN